MTKILCNNNGGQMIFNTFGECAKHFKVTAQKVRYAIDNDKFLRDENGTWWLDELIQEEA